MEEYRQEYRKYLEESVENAKKLVEEAQKAEFYAEKLDNMSSIQAKDSLLSPEEQEVFSILLKLLDTDKYILWSQVSFSAFLSAKTQDWYEYNKFYVDFLILTRDEKKPILIIEYYGAKQHKLGKARARDNFRKAIIKKANLTFIELEKKDDIVKQKQYDNFFKYIQGEISKECPQIIKKNQI